MRTIGRQLRGRIFKYVPLTFKHRVYGLLRLIYDYSRLTLELVLVNVTRRTTTTKACHMLVCQKQEYVSISKFAISSFLYFNKDYTIILHTDKILKNKCDALARFFPNTRLSVLQDIPDEGYPYELKGLLILGLQGTSDLFLDVDTRTNGTLPDIYSPLTLVAEFKMSDNVNFRQILSEMSLEGYENFYLLNVSIFCWAGKHFGIERQDFINWSQAYMNIKWESFLNSDQIPYFKRFVEQVFFSLQLQKGEIQLLKENDHVGDKGIVECSYFGASGYRFGR